MSNIHSHVGRLTYNRALLSQIFILGRSYPKSAFLQHCFLFSKRYSEQKYWLISNKDFEDYLINVICITPNKKWMLFDIWLFLSLPSKVNGHVDKRITKTVYCRKYTSIVEFDLFWILIRSRDIFFNIVPLFASVLGIRLLIWRVLLRSDGTTSKF